MKGVYSLIGGLAGAAVLTASHESLKRIEPRAPRMDLLGMEVISNTLNKLNIRKPTDRQLYLSTLAGDIISNTAYYSLIGLGRRNRIVKGAILGLVAGLGGVFLPGPLGLNPAKSSRSLTTQALTIALYFVGGIVAAKTIKTLEERQRKDHMMHVL